VTLFAGTGTADPKTHLKNTFAGKDPENVKIDDPAEGPEVGYTESASQL
jgi:hypothetical protein